jgi:hypothetical protein
MSMSEQQSWWYCTKHNTVEPDDGLCPGKDKLGPYATREEAEHALETVQRRNEDWDKAD